MSGNELTFQLSGDVDFSRFSTELQLLPEQVSKAAKSAAQKAGRWAEREGSKALASVSNLSVAQLREATRYRYRFKNKNLQAAQIWFGLNEVALKHAGATQTKTGVSSPRGNVPSAFIVQKLGGHVFVREGQRRLPIRKVTYEIVDDAEAVLYRVAMEAADMFRQLLFDEFDKLKSFSPGTSASILSKK